MRSTPPLLTMAATQKNTSAKSAACAPPLLMHLGDEDEFISKTAQAQIKAALAKRPNATVYSYPGQRHAFSRHNGTHYNATAAALANGRTSEFLNPNGGLIVNPDAFTTANRGLIISLAARYRLPAVYAYRFYVVFVV